MHDISRSAQLLHGDEEVVYGDAGYQGIEKRAEIADKSITYRVAMRPDKRRALPNIPDGQLLGLVETAKAHVRAKVEHPFHAIKEEFGFKKLGSVVWPRTTARPTCLQHSRIYISLTATYWRQDERTIGVTAGRKLSRKQFTIAPKSVK